MKKTEENKVKTKEEAQETRQENQEGVVDSILKTVSYGTGVLIKRASKIGEVTKTKSWKKAVSKTGDFCGAVEEKTKKIIKGASRTVKEGIGDMTQSFKEGMESVGVEGKKTETEGKKAEAVKEAEKQETKVKVAKAKSKVSDRAKSFKADMEIMDEGKAAEIAKALVGSEVSLSAQDDKKTAKGKAKSKGKAKAAEKKTKGKTSSEKEAPVNADLEREIDNATKDVEEA